VSNLLLGLQKRVGLSFMRHATPDCQGQHNRSDPRLASLRLTSNEFTRRQIALAWEKSGMASGPGFYSLLQVCPFRPDSLFRWAKGFWWGRGDRLPVTA
jgi:hypothetical protein